MVQALFEFNYGLFNKSENCRASALMDSTLTCRFQLSSHETTQYYLLCNWCGQEWPEHDVLGAPEGGLGWAGLPGGEDQQAAGGPAGGHGGSRADECYSGNSVADL